MVTKMGKLKGLTWVMLYFSGYLATFAQAPQDAIRWGTKELSWSDFKGRPNPRGLPIGAETMSVIHIEISEVQPHHPQAIVEALFDPQKSWVSNRHPLLLEHERVHFAISELYARKLRKQLGNMTLDEATYEDQAIHLFHQMNRQMDQYQTQYDRETDFSRNVAMQAKWNEDIKAQLQKLEEAAEVTVKLKVRAK